MYRCECGVHRMCVGVRWSVGGCVWCVWVGGGKNTGMRMRRGV